MGKTKKTPVTWDRFCGPKNASGLKAISLKHGRTANCAKLHWNLCRKMDRLWVKWVHGYYMKKGNVMDCQVPKTFSCVLKAILKCRDMVKQTKVWESWHNLDKFPTGREYKEIRGDALNVSWKKLFYDNIARLRSHFIC